MKPTITAPNTGPYRTPGDTGEHMPRPIERKFEVSLFLQGGNENALDSAETQAINFHDWLEQECVQNQSLAFKDRNILAVEVKKFYLEV